MFYVYILKSLRDGNLYIGYTNDLKKRVKEHNGKRVFSTKSRAPFELVYYEAYKAEGDARAREKQLKEHGRALGGLKRRLRKSLLQNQS